MVLLVGASPLVTLLRALLQRLPEMLDDVSDGPATVVEAYARFLEAGGNDAVAPTEVALRRLVWSAQLSLQAPAEGRDTEVPQRAPQGGPKSEGAGATGDGQIWAMFEELRREQRRRGLPLRNDPDVRLRW